MIVSVISFEEAPYDGTEYQLFYLLIRSVVYVIVFRNVSFRGFIICISSQAFFYSIREPFRCSCLYCLLISFWSFLLRSGWPRLQFFVTDNLGRPARDWQVPLLGKERKVPAYIEVSNFNKRFICYHQSLMFSFYLYCTSFQLLWTHYVIFSLNINNCSSWIFCNFLSNVAEAL